MRKFQKDLEEKDKKIRRFGDPEVEWRGKFYVSGVLRKFQILSSDVAMLRKIPARGAACQ